MKTTLLVYLKQRIALLLATFILQYSFVLQSSVQAVQPPPNILLIVSEDNGPELGCYGDPYARTPNLDRLAGEGVRFHRAFVPQAGCSQSRASLLTGLYPHQHGQIGLATWGFRMYRETTPNLPRSLKAVGYRTGIIGKLHINPESAFPFDFHEIKTANFARRDLANYARHAEQFMSAGEAPFFLSVNYPDAHDPFVTQIDGLPRDPLSGNDVHCLPYFGIDPVELRTPIANYYNCLSRLDSCIGDLMAALERTGKANNTLVVYLGDHGADFLRGKRTSYEGGVRIPLIVRWPRKSLPQVRSELVSTIDLLPTLLQISGANSIENLPGRSLLPLLTGEQTHWRTHLFTEYHTHAARTNFYPQRTVRDDRYKLIENLLPGDNNPDFKGKVSKEHPEIISAIESSADEIREAYARMQQPPRWELYDLKADPYEFRNLADSAEHAATLAALQRHLADWRQATHDPLLDQSNLQRLRAEVTAVTKKAERKSLAWGYPDYFFGREPTTSAKPSKNKGKANP